MMGYRSRCSVALVSCSLSLHPTLLIVIVEAFPIQPQSNAARSKEHRLFGSLDYEYLAPNQNGTSNNVDPTYHSNLPSSYPPGTPAGLRGEAIRSALRSDRCLAWNLQGTPLEHGVVQVTGPGTLAFLNNKLTQSFLPASTTAASSGYFKEASLLTAKGRAVDRLGVAVTNAETAFVVTSPGHTSQALFARLDPFIFPLDQISLTNCGHSADSTLFSLASSRQVNLQTCFDSYIWPMLVAEGQLEPALTYQLPRKGECLLIPLNEHSSNACQLLICPRSELPPSAGIVGCTFVFLYSDSSQEQQHRHRRLGDQIWSYLVSDRCSNGPVEAGALEFETLRIQSGQPAFGCELTGRDEATATAASERKTPASPLELFLSDTISSDKGCYLGQEGVASILKNPRGPPRTLYQVTFDDDMNLYDYQSRGEMSSGRKSSSSSSSTDKNLTRRPIPGDTLYALGSNEEIRVGIITSVAEPGGTGEAETLALALIRRPDGIFKQLQAMDIEIPTRIRPDEMDSSGSKSNMGESSLLIQPPPLDPLDGLEVIVGGTFTIGVLEMVAGRRRRNLFDDDTVPEFVKNLPREDAMRDLIPLTKLTDDRLLSEATIVDTVSTPVVEVELDDETAEDARQEEELIKAIAEASEAAAEAKRKTEKMELLRKRAEDAMERRKQKGTQ